MNTTRSLALIALVGAVSILPACGSDRSDVSAKEEKSTIRHAVAEAIVEAREEIRQGNITISEGGSRPKAKITPKGDLLIDGRAVALSPAQRAAMLEYRGHVAGVAESGMEIGAQGADLATKAMGEAFKGLFSGKSEKEVEQSVEAEAAKIKASAAKLCARLPAMMAAQHKAAAAVPEFKPYATMTQEDIDDCWDDNDDRKAEASQDEAGEAAAAAEQQKPTSSN